MIRRLLLLNGLAAFGVATFHAAAYGFDAMFMWADRYRVVTVPNYDQIGSMSYYMLLVIRQLDAFVIPAFIFVSGYFVSFLAGGDGRLRWPVVWTRVRNFFIPLLLWTIIRFILLRQPPTTIHDILRPYYFIVLLIQFYLMSPFIVVLAQRRWKSLLVITALIQFGAESLFISSTLGLTLPPLLDQVKDLLPLWFFPLRIFWFALGVVAGLHRAALARQLARYKWWLLGAVLVLAPLTIIEYEFLANLTDQAWLGPSFRGVTSKFYALAFIFAFLAFERTRFPAARQVSDLGTKSLGIYLANIPVIYVVAVILYRWAPWVLGNQLLYQGLLITAGLAIPLLLMALMSRSRFRWAYRYVFG